MHARPDLAITGEVLLRAGSQGPLLAEAIAIAGGRVVAAGSRDEIRRLAALRTEDAPGVVVPGLHDFHLHLIGMARARREVLLDALTTRAQVTEALRSAAASAEPGAWIRARGWHEGLLDSTALAADPALQRVPAIVYSHDSHSVWASPAAMERAGLTAASGQPAGGRIERDAAGHPTGVLRERASEPVEVLAGRLDGEPLAAALRETLAELAASGITGATDAGDALVENGIGAAAALGDRASRLLALREVLDDRMRVTVDVPADAIEAAAELGLATGRPLPGASTVRGGWAKAYADGALGSRTAALFAPYTCDPGGTGILRLRPEELDDRVAAGRRHRIGLAVHAIGDRAASAVLDAFERGFPPQGKVLDRIEHLQLVRAADRSRLARKGVVASIQPIHAAADRDAADACWADRLEDAYPWRTLIDAGAVMACGSDAPIESADPWQGLFAAVHRRHVGDRREDWQPSQAVTALEALAGYTVGPAQAIGASGEGHLGVGAVADLAVLNVDLATLLAADERLAAVRSVLTLVNGVEMHRA